MPAGTFPLIPRRRVIGLAFGGIRSARRGSGSDAAGSRQYVPGDNLAWIDWAASARLPAVRDNDEFIVHEFFADEAPHVVMASRRPETLDGDSPLTAAAAPTSRRRLLESLRLIRESARVTRSLTAYLDHADGETTWRPPRSERFAPQGTLEGRSFEAPADTVSRSLEHLRQHRRELPTQTFVFVLSDFLVLPDEHAWQRTLEQRWEVVPVVIQDPVWERSFPDVGALTVPYADPDSGAVVPVYLTRAEAERLCDEHEERQAGLPELLPRLRHRAGADRLARSGRDPRRVPSLGRPPDDGAGSARMTRAAVIAIIAVLAALAAAPAGADVPPVHGGSVLGRNLPLKMYARVDPPVHLFGDPITATVAVVVDRKWVAPSTCTSSSTSARTSPPGPRPWSAPATDASCR